MGRIYKVKCSSILYHGSDLWVVSLNVIKEIRVSNVRRNHTQMCNFLWWFFSSDYEIWFDVYKGGMKDTIIVLQTIHNIFLYNLNMYQGAKSKPLPNRTNFLALMTHKSCNHSLFLASIDFVFIFLKLNISNNAVICRVILVTGREGKAGEEDAGNSAFVWTL